MFLPDGEHFVFLLWTNSAVLRDSVGGIYVGSTRNRETRRISTAPSSAWFVAGDLFFARERMLMRAPLHLESLTLGTPVATGDRIDWDSSTGLAFMHPPTGTLTLRQNNPVSSTRLVWFDRTGVPTDSVGERMSYQRLAIARHAACGVLSVNDAATGSNDIWVMDFSRGLSTRFTRDPADEADPAISADGRGLAYISDVGGPYHVFTGPVDQSKPVERISPPAEDWTLLDWSRDGALMLLATASDSPGCLMSARARANPAHRGGLTGEQGVLFSPMRTVSLTGRASRGGTRFTSGLTPGPAVSGRFPPMVESPPIGATTAVKSSISIPTEI